MKIEKLCIGSQQSFYLKMTVYEVATMMVVVVKFMFFCNDFMVGKILSLPSNIKFHLRLFVYQKLVADAKQMGFCSSAVSQRCTNSCL